MAHLRGEQWTTVSANAPVLAFIKAEWDKWASTTRWIDRRLVSQPNLNDHAENQLRVCLLSIVRGGLFQHLPQDTEWFEVRLLRREHLGQLRVIGRCGWDDPGDHNELIRVASRRPQPLQKSVTSWDPLLLWGHGKEGPFTILEGNNRLTAFAASATPEMILNLSCYIGLSTKPCYWHLADDFSAGSA